MATKKPKPVRVTLSKTAEALAWLAADPSRKQVDAAEKFGVTPGALTHARKQREIHGSCPHCGQLLRYTEGRGPVPKELERLEKAEPLGQGSPRE